MSAGILLIDGYNLLHAAGMGQRDYRRGELLRCRTRLLTFLVNHLSPAETKEATLVFDARDPPPDRPSQVVVSGLKVLFANPGGDADLLIQEWLSRHPSPRRVRLVSSDRALQRAARGCGSKFIGSADFLDELARRGRAAPLGQRRANASADESKPSASLSESQTAYWMKVFGDVPIVESEADDLKIVAAAPGAAPKPKQHPATNQNPRRSQTRRAQDDSKTADMAAHDELAYWLKVFGGQSSSGTAAGLTEELRLADLENWLKNFEAEEGTDENNRH